MRWDSLFDDLESQLERELTAEDIDLEAEEERLRLGRLSVRDRLAAIHHAQGAKSDYRITLMLTGGGRVVVLPSPSAATGFRRTSSTTRRGRSSALCRWARWWA